MSKFNKIPDIGKELYERSDAVLNYEGALSFKLDPLAELYLRAASSLVGEPKFYTDECESDMDLLESFHKAARIDPEFILQLAVYCRDELYLRSIPIMLIAEFANSPDCRGKVPGARKYVERVVQRADEIKELFAYQMARNKVAPRPSSDPTNRRQDKQNAFPNMLKYGLMNAFNKFDKYQFGKYNKEKEVVKLRDVMFMSHPKPFDELHKEVFDKLTNKTLESPETWEVMISAGKMDWHDVIHDIFYKNMRVNNYMAILRNIRNCLEDQNVTKEDIELLCRMLTDRKAVKYSKQLPFRFFSAYKELNKVGAGSLTSAGNLYLQTVLDALEDAVLFSVENYPQLSGSSTLIACDVSGSMEKPISAKSSVERFDVGIMLGMMANSFCGHTITGFFGDDWKVIPMPKTGILRNALEMHRREGEVGYSTNGYKVFTYLLDNDIEVDRILMFTDQQMWNSEEDKATLAEYFYRYQRKHPAVKFYGFDMSGYGTVMVPQNTRNFCVIGGFSDRVFDFIKIFEEVGDGSAAIQKIKGIKP